jgi:cytochrome c-type biogenesis protein CcmH/NrfG
MTEAKPQFSSPLRRKRLPLILLAVVVLAGGVFWTLRSRSQDNLEEASLAELQEITKQRPEDARALYYLGVQYGKRQKKAESLRVLERAAQLAPDDEKIWIAKAGAVNSQQGPAAAFAVMRDYMKRHPESAAMKQERASLLWSLQRAAEGFGAAGRYSEAKAYYEMWLAEDPDNTAARQSYETMLKAMRDTKSKPKSTSPVPGP